jgi:hypothetical protein
MKGETFLPEKWLKYEVMDLYGLARLEDIQARIHRFSPKRHSAAIGHLRRSILRSVRQGQDKFFVAKFVPRKLSFLLPNVRIHSLRDLNSLIRVVRERSKVEEELWFCDTSIARDGVSVAGRISIDLVNGVTLQTIEQVWRCSPRLIESLSADFPLPFIRATRQGWNWSPKIEYVHLPPGNPETAIILQRQLADALLKVDENKETFEHFVEAIRQLDLGVCLEYKVENNRLQIIDWDTANDSKVVNALLKS